jgi:hypothetical protein
MRVYLLPKSYFLWKKEMAQEVDYNLQSFSYESGFLPFSRLFFKNNKGLN